MVACSGHGHTDLVQASHRSARGVDAVPGARVADPPVGDPRPVLLTSDASRGSGGRALGVRDVLAAAPRRARRLRRSRGSGLALIGVALVGSIGAVSAVNVALFPHLGETTAESVWQNPGRVPPQSLESTSTTPRSDRTVVVDPTVPPRLVAVAPSTAPSSSAATEQVAGTEAIVESASVTPGQRPAGSGGSTPTTVAGVTVTGTTLPRSPAAPSGSGSGSGSTGSGTVVTAAGGTGGTDDTGPDTSATVGTAPSNTWGTSNSSPDTSDAGGSTAPDVSTATSSPTSSPTSVDDHGGRTKSGSGSGSGGSGSGSGSNSDD
jgi:hypothetical protein